MVKYIFILISKSYLSKKYIQFQENSLNSKKWIFLLFQFYDLQISFFVRNKLCNPSYSSTSIFHSGIIFNAHILLDLFIEYVWNFRFIFTKDQWERIVMITTLRKKFHWINIHIVNRYYWFKSICYKIYVIFKKF